MGSSHTVQIILQNKKLNALAHTVHIHTYIHVDIHLVYCHRDGLPRFGLRGKSWAEFWTQDIKPCLRESTRTCKSLKTTVVSSRTSNQILPETKQMELTTTANYIQEDGMSIRQGNEWRNVVQCFDLLCNFLEPATPNLNSNKEVQCSCTDPFLWSVESDGESNTAGVTHGAHSQEFLSMTHLVLCPDVGRGAVRQGDAED